MKVTEKKQFLGPEKKFRTSLLGNLRIANVHLAKTEYTRDHEARTLSR